MGEGYPILPAILALMLQKLAQYDACKIVFSNCTSNVVAQHLLVVPRLRMCRLAALAFTAVPAYQDVAAYHRYP